MGDLRGAAGLARLRALPDGVLAERPAGGMTAVVVKRSGQVGLYFAGEGGELEGPMSRIDPARPLHLLAEYTQALALALLLCPDPARVCVVGLGGGRLSLVLHHHLPAATVVSVDVDPALAEIAEEFFGLELGERQVVAIADGREYLERGGERFDVILLDAFSDHRDELDRLGTREFYAAARGRLAQGGCAGVNLLRSDRNVSRKAAAFASVFPRCYAVGLRHGLVLLGATHAGLPSAHVMRRATELQRRHAFDFPLMERAAELRPFRPTNIGLEPAPPLTDADVGA